MAKNRVIVDDRFAKVTGQVEGAVKVALENAAVITEEAAKGFETRIRTGQLHESITHTPPLKIGRGWMVYVYDPVFYSRFQEFGTRARKGAKTSRRQKDITGARGVKPLHFMRNAARTGRAALLEELAREVGKKL